MGFLSSRFIAVASAVRAVSMQRRYLRETSELSVSYLGKSTEKKFSEFDWYKNEIVARSVL
jgi:hypothetical protein